MSKREVILLLTCILVFFVMAVLGCMALGAKYKREGVNSEGFSLFAVVLFFGGAIDAFVLLLAIADVMGWLK
jgi:hypothetical protein